jgi:hypothetical protein
MRLLKTWREFAITRLTDSDKETGFLPNQSAATMYFLKKPGFWAAMRKSLQLNPPLLPRLGKIIWVSEDKLYALG